MCNFVARTNWSNIESNYFMHSIIVLNLPYYMNVIITVTFVNQVTLSCTFLLFLPENYPHKSSAISKSICMCLTFTRKFLTAPTSITMWSGWPSFKTNRSKSHTAEWIIFAVTGIGVCSPLFKTPFTAVMLEGFLSLMKGSSSTTRLPFPSIFFGLGPLIKTPFTAIVLDGFLLLMKGLSLTARSPFPSVFFWTWCDEQSCQAQLRPSNRGQWFFVWWSFLWQAHCYKNQWNTLSWKQQLCQ